MKTKNPVTAKRTTKIPVLDRRAVLRGLGVSMALPWLEIMTPTRRAHAATKPLRFVAVTAPHGIHMPNWTPKETGANYNLPPILQPLAALKSQFSVVSGLANYPSSITTKEFAGSHARGTGAVLTQAPLRFTSTKDIQNGISVDQVIANQIKSQTRLPSLEIGAAAGSATGNCEDGYSCAYMHNISWASSTTFMPKETKPSAIFSRIFAGGLPKPAPTVAGMTPVMPQPNKELIYRKNILDLVRTEASQLGGRLGSRDKAKLEEYLTSVGELQRRVGELEKNLAQPAPVAAACKPGNAPTDERADYGKHLQLLSDMLVMAFECDITRVATYMQENPFNARNFSFLGISSDHHELSHHGGSASKHASLTKIATFEIQQFAYLLDKMSKSVDPDGQSMLQNSVVLFTSEFGDGDDHFHWDLPMLVAGGAGGKFKPGRHINYPHKGSSGPSNKTDMPMANLFVSILQAYGMDQTFGTDGQVPYGTKPLVELEG